MKNILIIGEHSYIGNALEEYVKLNIPRDIKDWTIEKVGAINQKWKLCDFSNYNVVILVAAMVHQKETKTNIDNYYRINRDMAIEIAKKAKLCKVSLFVFFSTMSVFGKNTTIINKTTKPNPSTHYGISKLEAEIEIMKLQNPGVFDIAIIRPPMVYGPGCKGNYQKLRKLAKIVPVFPDIHNKRSMISIDNLCEFIIHVIHQSETDFYHPQDPNYICTTELYTMLRNEYGKKTWKIPISYNIISIISKQSDILQKLFGDYYYLSDEI